MVKIFQETLKQLKSHYKPVNYPNLQGRNKNKRTELTKEETHREDAGY